MIVDKMYMEKRWKKVAKVNALEECETCGWIIEQRIETTYEWNL